MLLSRTLRNSARDLGYPEVPKGFPGDRRAKKWPGTKGIGLLGVPVASQMSRYPVLEKKYKSKIQPLSQKPNKMPDPINLKSARGIQKVCQSVSPNGHQAQS